MDTRKMSLRAINAPYVLEAAKKSVTNAFLVAIN